MHRDSVPVKLARSTCWSIGEVDGVHAVADSLPGESGCKPRWIDTYDFRWGFHWLASSLAGRMRSREICTISACTYPLPPVHTSIYPWYATNHDQPNYDLRRVQLISTHRWEIHPSRPLPFWSQPYLHASGSSTGDHFLLGFGSSAVPCCAAMESDPACTIQTLP
jgi:hypothetical protein